jgi:hypothetical protein
MLPAPARERDAVHLIRVRPAVDGVVVLKPTHEELGLREGMGNLAVAVALVPVPASMEGVVDHDTVTHSGYGSSASLGVTTRPTGSAGPGRDES